MAHETADYWDLHWESPWVSCLVFSMVDQMAFEMDVHSVSHLDQLLDVD